MRYLDKVNYIQPTHNGGKTHGDTEYSRLSIPAVMHYIWFGLQHGHKMYSTVEAT